AGFFAKRLRGKFEHVIGIDWDRYAIAAAQKDAMPNETYLAGDVAENLASANLTALSRQSSEAAARTSSEPMTALSRHPGDVAKRNRKWTLIVDPPATG